MKRTSFFFAGIVIGLLSLTSCVFNFIEGISGDGNVKVESRDVPDFKSLEASGGLNVYVTFGSAVSVQVEADENLHDVIKTEVTAGTLRVFSEKNIRNAKAKSVRITVPTLDEIEVSSAADVKCENMLDADELSLSASSAGDMRLEILSKNVKAEVSSSGSIEIKGEAEEFEADASSAGSIDADKLKTKFCRVTASSAGSAKVWVTDELKAEASSAGNIRYQGEPKNIKVNTSSAGSISQR